MVRLIDADALKECVIEPSMYDINKRDVIDLIDEQPTIDAVPVVHARWEDHHCTNCVAMCVTAKTPQDWVYNIETPHCPHCGAKMDG